MRDNKRVMKKEVIEKCYEAVGTLMTALVDVAYEQGNVSAAYNILTGSNLEDESVETEYVDAKLDELEKLFTELKQLNK